MEMRVWRSSIAVCVLMSVFFQLVALVLGVSAVTDRARLIAALSAILFAAVGAALAVASIWPTRASGTHRAVASTVSAFLACTAALACWLIATTPTPN